MGKELRSYNRVQGTAIKVAVTHMCITTSVYLLAPAGKMGMNIYRLVRSNLLARLYATTQFSDEFMILFSIFPPVNNVKTSDSVQL